MPEPELKTLSTQQAERLMKRAGDDAFAIGNKNGSGGICIVAD
jgi:hypothetical protein